MPSVKVQVLLLCSVLCLVRGDSFSGQESPTKSVEPWEDVCPHKICQGVPEGRILDNPQSCAAYFACVEGRAWAGECPEGSWFNYYAQICDVPWHVPCDAEASEIIELECVPEPSFIISCRNDDDLHTIQHPFDCTQYYLCIEGRAMLRSCAPGLEFNTEASQCMVPEEAACKFGSCPSYNVPLTFLPSTKNCSEFSICLNGEPVNHRCADGLYWDPDNNWCTFPEETSCEIEGSGEELEIICHEDSPVFNPHPTDCTLYFLCSGNSLPHVMSCLEGLYFDMVSSQCMPIDSATCYPGSE